MKKEDEKNVNGVEETQVAESAAEPVAEENAVGAETAVSAETESAAVRSDEANGEASIDYTIFASKAAKNAINITLEFIKKVTNKLKSISYGARQYHI